MVQAEVFSQGPLHGAVLAVSASVTETNARPLQQERSLTGKTNVQVRAKLYMRSINIRAETSFQNTADNVVFKSFMSQHLHSGF